VSDACSSGGRVELPKESVSISLYGQRRPGRTARAQRFPGFCWHGRGRRFNSSRAHYTRFDQRFCTIAQSTEDRDPSPTSLLLFVAAGDHLTPSDLALEAYQQAREPKKLALQPGGHFDAYVKDFDTASGTARDWFLERLRPR
jgi:hypothetical protein